jgi:hypothetical protein
MFLTSFIPSLLLLLPIISSLPLLQAAHIPKSLHLTAITTNANNASIFECWSLSPPFTTSTGSGTIGASTLPLGSFSQGQGYTVIPPHFDAGVHNAPAPQLVVFLSGLANVSLVEANEFVMVKGGKNGVIIAVDTMGTGHITRYTGNKETIILQLPFEGGKVPEHVVVHGGACRHGSVKED